MRSTKAKKDFKKRFGQANHFLVTTLVGLGEIEAGRVTEKAEEFRASWNPNDTQRSAARAKVFALQSFLGWAVESLEMYLKVLNRKPKGFESEEFGKIFSSSQKSIYKKAIGVGEYAQVDPVLVALIEVLITWRNYTFHYDIDNQIRDDSKELLTRSSDRINEEFCGLDVDRLISSWETRGDFTFKETASLINATHQFVSEIDLFAISQVDEVRYVTDALDVYFKNNSKAQQKLRALPREKRVRYIKNVILQILGFSVTEERIRERHLPELLS